MLSNFALEHQLHTARQELSYVLYQGHLAIHAQININEISLQVK